MGLIDSFFLLGLFLFGIPLASLIGWLLGKVFGMPRLGGCLPGLVLLFIIFGFPALLALTGVKTSALVAAKGEKVSVLQYTGEWYHTYSLGVRFNPPGAKLADETSRTWSSDSVSLIVRVTRDQFDRARIGTPVAITYLPYRPSIGKLTDRSILDLVKEILAVPSLFHGLMLLVGMVIAVWLSTRHIETRPLRTVRVVLYAACFVTVMYSMWMGFKNPESVAESQVNVGATARVVQSRRIDRTLADFSTSTNSSGPLAQPFDVVEVEFLWPATNQLVRAADAVDSGSIRGLDAGQTLAIRYNERQPRTMRIVGGTRTFREKNSRDIGRQALFVLAFLVVVFAGSSFLARRKAKTKASRRAT